VSPVELKQRLNTSFWSHSQRMNVMYNEKGEKWDSGVPRVGGVPREGAREVTHSKVFVHFLQGGVQSLW
jgi:hypothetical protein